MSVSRSNEGLAVLSPLLPLPLVGVAVGEHAAPVAVPLLRGVTPPLVDPGPGRDPRISYLSATNSWTRTIYVSREHKMLMKLSRVKL